jgi:hypothetical protein
MSIGSFPISAASIAASPGASANLYLTCSVVATGRVHSGATCSMLCRPSVSATATVHINFITFKYSEGDVVYSRSLQRLIVASSSYRHGQPYYVVYGNNVVMELAENDLFTWSQARELLIAQRTRYVEQESIIDTTPQPDPESGQRSFGATVGDDGLLRKRLMYVNELSQVELVPPVPDPLGGSKVISVESQTEQERKRLNKIKDRLELLLAELAGEE